MFILACDDYENEVARLEGEMELEEIELDSFTTAQDIVNFLNKRMQEDDKRYTDLLGSYTELQKDIKTAIAHLEIAHGPATGTDCEVCDFINKLKSD